MLHTHQIDEGKVSHDCTQWGENKKKNLSPRFSHRCVIRHTRACLRPASPYTEAKTRPFKSVQWSLQNKSFFLKKACARTHTHTCYLMDDEWTLKTTFAGAITQQIGLDLIQRGEGSATGTTQGRKKTHVKVGGCRAVRASRYLHFRSEALRPLKGCVFKTERRHFMMLLPTALLNELYDGALLLQLNDEVHCCSWFSPAPLHFSG